MNLTRQQYDEICARLERARAAKGQAGPLECAIKTAFAPPPPTDKKRIRQDSKPLMNALESRGLLWANSHFGMVFRAQSLRFRLGNGIWYKPDATAIAETGRLCLEFKGPFAFRGGFENLKVAAGLYPEWKWILAWEEKGEWKTQTVLP